MCQRGERVMVSLLIVEKLTLSRCAQADVQKEKKRILLSSRQETIKKTIFLTTLPVLFLSGVLKPLRVLRGNKKEDRSGGCGVRVKVLMMKPVLQM